MHFIINNVDSTIQMENITHFIIASFYHDRLLAFPR